MTRAPQPLSKHQVSSASPSSRKSGHSGACQRKLFGELTEAGDISGVCASPPPSLKRQVSSDSHGSHGSSDASSRKLLFGEIPSTAPSSAQSVRSNSSVCNLVMSSSPSFLRFWLSDNCRDAFLSSVDEPALANLRLVCHDLGTRAAPFLFRDMTITFRPSTFTRPARIEALERIGQHVKTLTFSMSHSPDTFLAPLIDPVTGEQKNFVYEPQVQKPVTLVGRVKQPKYGSWEITDLLIKQYPPLFHASTNIPAFCRALSAVPSLKHLRVNCPGQDQWQRSRRSAVDYALISLRIAVERAPLRDLDTLTIQSLHPGGLLYLQPMLGFGSTPGSHKRWGQIRTLALHMDSAPVSDRAQTEHLRILHSYLRAFAPSLTRLVFRWRGTKGPSPVSLDSEPGLDAYSPSTAHATAPRTPAHSNTQTQAPHALHFPNLTHMALENATMDAAQVSAFIRLHRHTLSEFALEHIALRSGNWDDALAPLTSIAGGEDWKRQQRGEEVMDVPLMMAASAVGTGTGPGTPPSSSPPPLPKTPVVRPAEEQRSPVPLGRWLGTSKRRSGPGKAVEKAREQFWGCEEGVKRFLRSSVFPWR